MQRDLKNYLDQTKIVKKFHAKIYRKVIKCRSAITVYKTIPIMQKVGNVLFLLLINAIAVVGQIFAEESIKSGKKRWTSNQPRSRDISPKKNFLPSLLHPLYAFLIKFVYAEA